MKVHAETRKSSGPSHLNPISETSMKVGLFISPFLTLDRKHLLIVELALKHGNLDNVICCPTIHCGESLLGIEEVPPDTSIPNVDERFTYLKRHATEMNPKIRVMPPQRQPSPIEMRRKGDLPVDTFDQEVIRIVEKVFLQHEKQDNPEVLVFVLKDALAKRLIPTSQPNLITTLWHPRTRFLLLKADSKPVHFLDSFQYANKISVLCLPELAKALQSGPQTRRKKRLKPQQTPLCLEGTDRLNQLSNAIQTLLVRYSLKQVEDRYNVYASPDMQRRQQLEEEVAAANRADGGRRPKRNDDKDNSDAETQAPTPPMCAILEMVSGESEQIRYFNVCKSLQMRNCYLVASFGLNQIERSLCFFQQTKNNFCKAFPHTQMLKFVYGNLLTQRISDQLRMSDPTAISYTMVDDEPEDDKADLLDANHGFEEGATLWVQIVSIQNGLRHVFFDKKSTTSFLYNMCSRLCTDGLLAITMVNPASLALLAAECLETQKLSLYAKYFSCSFASSQDIWRCLLFGDTELFKTCVSKHRTEYQEFIDQYRSERSRKHPIDARDSDHGYGIRYKLECDAFFESMPEADLAYLPKYSPDDDEWEYMVPLSLLHQVTHHMGFNPLGTLSYAEVAEALIPPSAEGEVGGPPPQKGEHPSFTHLKRFLALKLPVFAGESNWTQMEPESKKADCQTDLNYYLADPEERRLAGLYMCVLSSKRAMATTFCLDIHKALKSLKRRVARLVEEEKLMNPEDNKPNATGFVRKLNVHKNEVQLLTKKTLRDLKPIELINEDLGDD